MTKNFLFDISKVTIILITNPKYYFQAILQNISFQKCLHLKIFPFKDSGLSYISLDL